MATYTFDKTTKIIQVASPATAIGIQELVDAIRDYEDDLSAGMSIPSLARAAGKSNLGGGAETGITLTLLDGWTLQFEPRGGPTWDTCIIQDGNLVGLSGAAPYNPIEQADYVSVIQLGAIAGFIATPSGLSASVDASAVSAAVNLSLSAYEATGVASKADLTGVSASLSSGDILSALSAYRTSGVAGIIDLTGVSGSVDQSGVSAATLLALSAYESTGVASKEDINNISAAIDASAVAAAVSGAIVSGIGAWGDLRWSKIYGIPLQQWDVIILEEEEQP